MSLSRGGWWCSTSSVTKLWQLISVTSTTEALLNLIRLGAKLSSHSYSNGLFINMLQYEDQVIMNLHLAMEQTRNLTNVSSSVAYSVV